MMHGRMLCGSPIELAQKTSKKRMIDAAIAQTYCSRICIRSSGVEAHGRIQRGGTATADQVTDSGYNVKRQAKFYLKLRPSVIRNRRFVREGAIWLFAKVLKCPEHPCWPFLDMNFYLPKYVVNICHFYA
jgi:hypothetical protein